MPRERQASDVWGQSGAEPDVRVGVGAGVVAVQVEDTGAGTAVPAATAIREPPQIKRPIPDAIFNLWP